MVGQKVVEKKGREGSGGYTYSKKGRKVTHEDEEA